MLHTIRVLAVLGEAEREGRERAVGVLGVFRVELHFDDDLGPVGVHGVRMGASERSIRHRAIERQANSPARTEIVASSVSVDHHGLARFKRGEHPRGQRKTDDAVETREVEGDVSGMETIDLGDSEGDDTAEGLSAIGACRRNTR